MSRRLISVGAAALLVVLTSLPAPTPAQTSGFPSISERQFTGGSAKVTLKGEFVAALASQFWQ